MENITDMLENGLILIRDKINRQDCDAFLENKFYKPLSDERRAQALHNIETTVLQLIRQAASGQDPELCVPRTSDWCSSQRDGVATNNTPRKSGVGLPSQRDNSEYSRVRLSVPSSRRKFALLVMILSRVHKLLSNKSTCTRRQVYYEQVSWLRSQREVDNGVVCVGRLLGLPPWQLGLLATAKGLVSGDLVLVTTDGERIDCAARPGGILIPSDMTNIQSVQSSARFILLLEKDTIFQRLLDEGATNRLGPCIVITGKGYPDVSTRVLLARLDAELRVPILAVVDADPHGIHIMSVYRFGTKSAPLAIPSVRWLGLLPTEVGSLGVRAVPLTPHDVTLARSLLDKTRVKDTPAMCAEIEAILTSDLKAEVDALTSFSSCYLTDVYLPSKIAAGDVI